MPASPNLLTVLLALSAIAATASADTQVTWAAVAFVYHGEKTPDLVANGHSDLTPLGANQMLQAGSVVRARYVSPPVNGSDITIATPINGLSANGIENPQLTIYSTDDEFVTASALAFVQGLYPPRDTTVVDAESILSNSSLEQYPLGGYQYPNIQSLSNFDLNYIWVAGNVDCTSYEIAAVESTGDPVYTTALAATSSFYSSLASEIFYPLDPALVTYAKAYELYEFALYESNHNASMNSILTPGDLYELYYLASQREFSLNSASTSDKTSILPISGQTLASIVIQQFMHVIDSSGRSETDKLTLLFGFYEPMLSFFSLSSLATNYNSNPRFTSLPLHGSTLAFELFSYTNESVGTTTSTPFPDPSELWVRFLFRNGTDSHQPLSSYPLFGRANSETDMSFQDFTSYMGQFSIDDQLDWCNLCASVNIFCQAISGDACNSTENSTITSSKGLKPAIAGIIGATVTLATGLLVAMALCLGGFRLTYLGRGDSDGGLGVLRRTSTGKGGFKGAEKLASDTDLTVVKTGAGAAGASVVRHERVGSWELKSGDDMKKDAGSVQSGGVESGRMERVVTRTDYNRKSDDGFGDTNPFGEGVRPVDHV